METYWCGLLVPQVTNLRNLIVSTFISRHVHIHVYMQVSLVQPERAEESVCEMPSPALNKKKGCTLLRYKSICAV